MVVGDVMSKCRCMTCCWLARRSQLFVALKQENNVYLAYHITALMKTLRIMV